MCSDGETDRRSSVGAMTALELSQRLRDLGLQKGVSSAAADAARAGGVSSRARAEKLAAIGRLARVLQSIGELRVLRRRWADADEMLAALSLDLPVGSVCLARYIPIRVYLSSGGHSTSEKLGMALGQFLGAFGFDISTEYEPELGSWFKKLIARTQKPQTKEVLFENLEMARRALELQALQKTQSEIDRNQAIAASSLITALKDESTYVVQIGSILMVKEHDPQEGSNTFVRSLTQRELIYLEAHPEIVRDPQAIRTRLLEASSLVDQNRAPNIFPRIPVSFLSEHDASVLSTFEPDRRAEGSPMPAEIAAGQARR